LHADNVHYVISASIEPPVVHHQRAPALPFVMSTTTYATSLDTAPRAVLDGRRAHRIVTPAHRPARGAFAGSFSAASPFASLAQDRRRRVVATTLATLAWIPVLALTVVAFAVVGVVAAVATASAWAWRSVSPAQPRPTRPCCDEDDGTPCDTSAVPRAPARGRRPVRDRTVGHDA
jgi:hypothetical protein